MKLGILLFILGSALILYLVKIEFEKEVLKRLGIVFGILMLLYGLILVVQPSEGRVCEVYKNHSGKR